MALIGLDDVDFAEERGRTAVAYGIDLHRFALAVIEGAVLLVIGRAGDGFAGIPEVRGLCLIRDAAQHPSLLPAFDFPERIAAKLKVVALLVDGETAIAIDQNAVIH